MGTEERPHTDLLGASVDAGEFDEQGEVESPEEAERRKALDKAHEILKEARYYRFFTLIPLLERLSPDSERVGGDGPPAREAVRFRHDIDLSFTPGDISAGQPRDIPLDPRNDLSPKKHGFEVTTTFLGLTGSASPLPLYFAEEVAFESQDNPIRRDFLDIFHHRIISLLYRSVMRYALVRESTSDGQDDWTKRAFCVAGFDAFNASAGKYVSRAKMLRLLPLLAGHVRSAEGLEKALEATLRDELGPNATVEVKQFCGNRVTVDEKQRTRLGVTNCVLGRGLVMGSRTTDRAGRFTVKLGPLGGQNYGEFMANGDQMKVIQEVANLFTRRQFDYDLELVMSDDAVPKFELSTKRGSPLGRRTWLRGGKHEYSVHTVKDAMSPGAG